jgi:hypothetical protein
MDMLLIVPAERRDRFFCLAVRASAKMGIQLARLPFRASHLKIYSEIHSALNCTWRNG